MLWLPGRLGIFPFQWSMDPVSISAGLGEKKLLTVTLLCRGKKLLPGSRLNYISSGIKTGVTLRMISTQTVEGGDEAIQD